MPIIVEPTMDPTSTLALEAIFLNDAEDPTDFIALAYIGDTYRVSSQVGGGVEHGYASGRSRAFSTEDDVTTVAFTATALSAEDIDWLEDHRGRTVSFRDLRGRKVFATYHDAQVEVSTLPEDLGDDTIPLTLVSTTFDESV